MRHKGFKSIRDFAKHCGVSDRYIGMILKQDSKASINTLDKIAHACDVDTWELLYPGLVAELIDNGRPNDLLQNYFNASSQGRKYINMVAEREAHYSTTKK